MNRIIRSTIVAVALLALAACSQWGTVDFNQSDVSQLGVKNLQVTSSTSLAAGQPTQEQLEALAKAGVKHVINLRPASEISWDEKALVEELGMEYHLIPVAGKPGITVANAKALDALMKKLDGEPLLLHCSSSNRVGSLMALGAYHIEGQSLEASIAKGKAWGLTRLEPFVRAKLIEK